MTGGGELGGLGERLAQVRSGMGGLGAQPFGLIVGFAFQVFEPGEPVFQARDQPRGIRIGQVFGRHTQVGSGRASRETVVVAVSGYRNTRRVSMETNIAVADNAQRDRL